MRHDSPQQLVAQDTARARLEAQRLEILERLGDLGSDLRGATSSQITEGTIANHPADAAGELLTAETDVSTMKDLQAELADVDDALGRIDDGTYGTCVDCGKPIDPGRLEARPQAARCVACQRRYDNEGR